MDNYSHLKSFKLASGFRVNFVKSSHIGMNVDPSFMDLASDFLNCYHKSFLFKYFDLMMGVNSHLETTRQPPITLLSRWISVKPKRMVVLEFTTPLN